MQSRTRRIAHRAVPQHNPEQTVETAVYDWGRAELEIRWADRSNRCTEDGGLTEDNEQAYGRVRRTDALSRDPKLHEGQEMAVPG